MAKTDEIDLFRDTSVRYLGYTNEVGESFRNLIPRSVVQLSYVIASGYVVADTIHRGLKEYEVKDDQKMTQRVLLSAMDALIWQSFASVIVPGFTINRICAGIRFLQRRSVKPTLKNPVISTIVGLISIPFIIHPIDHAVEETMNATYRRWCGYYPKFNENGNGKRDSHLQKYTFNSSIIQGK